MVNCYLCGGVKTVQISTKIRHIHDDKIKVYRCNDCGVHFLYPLGSEEDLSEYYEKEYRNEYEGENFYSSKMREEFFKQSLPEAEQRVARFKKYLKQTDDILEIGCSSGYFLHSIKPFVQTASGAEWDQNNAAYAKSLGFDICKNPQDFNKAFDKIFMFHVLEHIRDPIGYMESLKNYLKKDGLIVVEVPNNQDILLSRYDIQNFKEFYYCSAHLWYFNPKSLNTVMSKAGYYVELISLQRYDLSNHIQWLQKGIPGGQGSYDDVFTDSLKEKYVDMLDHNDLTDTIYAICKVKEC